MGRGAHPANQVWKLEVVASEVAEALLPRKMCGCCKDGATSHASYLGKVLVYNL